MTTRRRSSSRTSFFGALCVAVALVTVEHGASAQSPAADEAALRQRYGVSTWTSGPTHAGLSVDRLSVPGLSLRARTDRPVSEGGIALGFGPQSTTLLVRVSVGASVADGQASLVGYLRGVQTNLQPLADTQGADVALGDTTRGDEAIRALYGNVAVSIQRTREAGPETPSASRVLSILRSALAPASAPSAVRLSVQTRGGHLLLSGAAFAHVEATVQGGHLVGIPSPSGVDVAGDGPGPVEVRVVATDPLGRTSVASVTVLASPPAARP